MAEELTILAVADVCIGGRGEELLPHQVRVWKEGDDWYYWLEKVAPALQQGDFTVGNLEGALCERAAPILEKKGTGAGLLKMPPAVADALKKAGFDTMALANNHTMDYGDDGMVETLENLERVGIVPAGGGRNADEARRPAFLKRRGVTVAFLSYSSLFVPGSHSAADNKPGMATVGISTAYEVPSQVMQAPGGMPRVITYAQPGERERMEKEVRQAKSQADVVVVNWHWGKTRYAQSCDSGLAIDEAPFFVINYQEDLGRAAIDAGADLVIGHHPHRLQGMELYKGKLICYCLGILTMPFQMGLNIGEETVIVKGYIDPKTRQLSKVTLIPAKVPIATMQPHIVPIDQAGDIIALLERISKKYGTGFRAKDGEISVTAA